MPESREELSSLPDLSEVNEKFQEKRAYLSELLKKTNNTPFTNERNIERITKRVLNEIITMVQEVFQKTEIFFYRSDFTKSYCKSNIRKCFEQFDVGQYFANWTKQIGELIPEVYEGSEAKQIFSLFLQNNSSIKPVLDSIKMEMDRYQEQLHLHQQIAKGSIAENVVLFDPNAPEEDFDQMIQNRSEWKNILSMIPSLIGMDRRAVLNNFASLDEEIAEQQPEFFFNEHYITSIPYHLDLINRRHPNPQDFWDRIDVLVNEFFSIRDAKNVSYFRNETQEEKKQEILNIIFETSSEFEMHQENENYSKKYIPKSWKKTRHRLFHLWEPLKLELVFDLIANNEGRISEAFKEFFEEMINNIESNFFPRGKKLLSAIVEPYVSNFYNKPNCIVPFLISLCEQNGHENIEKFLREKAPELYAHFSHKSAKIYPFPA